MCITLSYFNKNFLCVCVGGGGVRVKEVFIAFSATAGLTCRKLTNSKNYPYDFFFNFLVKIILWSANAVQLERSRTAWLGTLWTPNNNSIQFF